MNDQLELLQVPRNIEAEQSVIGSMLIDARCVGDVMAKLHSQDFYMEQNRDIFETISAMWQNSENIDPITVLEEMRLRGVYDEANSRRYVLELMEITPTAASVLEYAELLKRESMRRELYDALEDAKLSLLGKECPQTLCASLQGKLEVIASEERSASLVSSAEAMLEFINYRDRVDSGVRAHVSSGFEKLDDLLGGGFVKEGLYILAARPGVGKTTLGLQIADAVAGRGVPTAFFSLEMSRVQLSAKRIAVDTGLSSNKILLGDMAEQDYEKVALSSAKLGKYRVEFNKKPSATVSEIGFLAKQMKGCGFVVVDYLGLVRHEGAGNLYERVTATSNELKRLARSLGIPILCLAQLNRENQNRANKTPMLSDLRDSGAIEQDADGVLLLHRPLMGNDEEPRDPQPVPLECILAKNRHGQTGKVDLNMYLRSGRIRQVYS